MNVLELFSAVRDLSEHLQWLITTSKRVDMGEFRYEGIKQLILEHMHRMTQDARFEFFKTDADANMWALTNPEFDSPIAFCSMTVTDSTQGLFVTRFDDLIINSVMVEELIKRNQKYRTKAVECECKIITHVPVEIHDMVQIEGLIKDDLEMAMTNSIISRSVIITKTKSPLLMTSWRDFKRQEKRVAKQQFGSNKIDKYNLFYGDREKIKGNISYEHAIRLKNTLLKHPNYKYQKFHIKPVNQKQ